MSNQMTVDECMEIFKKFDRDLYDYYMDNMWFFGFNARNYAEYLKNIHKE